eukprot:GILK01006951.1.p1 GENE.GILK01006951.1~~GILK01006951.1.p1  ORF type:complete len:340 (-),score=44.81 GILK01006951.1:50-1024(-)
MPKKKTGARKKAEKQKERQKIIQAGRSTYVDIGELPCNESMTCESCGRRQKNRAFCYFCGQTPRLPQCCHCGKTKCVAGGGDCVVKHPPGKHVTGMALVGAICDFCEAFICHSKTCLQNHACACQLRVEQEPAVCIECNRSVWEHGGRLFRCATCHEWLCEDDQFEHQASCQVLESDSYKCISCNRMGMWSCLRCKVCFCDDHVKGPTSKPLAKGEPMPCKKCRFPLQETKVLSMSVRKHEFGRLTTLDQRARDNTGYEGYYNEDQGDNDVTDDPYASFAANYNYGGYNAGYQGEEEEEYDDDDDEDGDEDDEEDEEEEEENAV